jgi:dephospho-CoA kinase
MIVIGLTGSIATGKSETARMFAELGVPVCEADAIVHALYAKGGAAVEPVARAFPGTAVDGAIDREKLSQALLGKPEKFARLEEIVHPLVRRAQEEFLARCRADKEPLAVLDIPLLFETGREKTVDKIVVVSAPAELQRARALARPGMTEEKLANLLARQMPDEEKRRRADFVVDSTHGIEHALRQVEHIVPALMKESGRHAGDRARHGNDGT